MGHSEGYLNLQETIIAYLTMRNVYVMRGIYDLRTAGENGSYCNCVVCV